MILEARHGIPPDWLTPDLCVIGAGPAGLTLAHALRSHAGLRVLLLEAGGERFASTTQQMYQGLQSGDRHAPLIRARWAGLGGSSRIWAGWCRPLDPLDFEARPDYPVPGWPIPHAAMSRYFEKAATTCGLTLGDFDLSTWAPSFPGEPLVPEGDLIHRVFQVRRLDFGEAYREAIASSPQQLLALHALVMRLVRHADQPARWGVEVTAGDRRQVVWPGRVVLAAGGLENVRLLLLSGETPDEVPGNSGGAVGRYFTEHGFADPGWFVPSDPERRLDYYFPAPRGHAQPRGMARAARRQALARPVLTLAPEVFRRERLLNAMLYFYPAYEAHPDFTHPSVRAALELWEVVKGQGVPLQLWPYLRQTARAPHRVLHALWRQARVRAPQPRWRLRCYFECIPCENNRITLSNTRDAWGRRQLQLDWRLQPQDLVSVHRFAQRVDEGLRQAGAGSLQLPPHPEAWRAVTECGKHPMGATRMASDASTGVVDRNCRVFGTDNLFIAGSSVFPAVGYANPTLTLVALTLRLADHLKALSD